MATHSSVLAWRIPGTGEPGGLPSMGLHRVGHALHGMAYSLIELDKAMIHVISLVSFMWLWFSFCLSSDG